MLRRMYAFCRIPSLLEQHLEDMLWNIDPHASTVTFVRRGFEIDGV